MNWKISLSASLWLVLSIPVSFANDHLLLNDVLHATIEKQQSATSIRTPNNLSTPSSFSWLDGVPSLSFMYLHNQTELGSKEAEISVSLPIKSQFMRQIEENMGTYHTLIQESAHKQLTLYYSGLIRELIWTYKAEALLGEIAQNKTQQLSRLMQQYAEMAAANAIPQYTLLLVQKEVNASRILQLQHSRNANKILKQYSNLTGLMALPTNIQENIPEQAQQRIMQHPDLIALDAAWNTFQENIKGQGKSSEAWNIKVSAKRIETDGLSENQIGLGVDIPLAVGEQLSTTQRYEYQQAKTDYDIARHKLLLGVKTSVDAGLAEYNFLLQKQALLEQGSVVVDKLEESVSALIESNAPNQEVHIRNLIAVIDAQGERSLNTLYIQRQIANTRQLLGLTL